MNPNAEFDIIVYGATGYTGRLVAEYLAQRYGIGDEKHKTVTLTETGMAKAEPEG